jgi:hypothetical protein
MRRLVRLWGSVGRRGKSSGEMEESYERVVV